MRAVPVERGMRLEAADLSIERPRIVAPGEEVAKRVGRLSGRGYSLTGEQLERADIYAHAPLEAQRVIGCRGVLMIDQHGLVAALLLARLWFGKADLTMTLNGALAGLIAITAEPLAPTPIGATSIGAVGGLLVVLSIVTLDKLRIDDPVGAISVHGVVGIWGLLAVLFYNESSTWWVQLVGILAIFGWVFGVSLLFWLCIKLTVGIRVEEEHEYEGVDIHECGLEAYPEFAVVE